MSEDFRRIIEDRRDNRPHSAADLKILANGAAKPTIPVDQLAAWLMAAYLNPLNRDETTVLTLAMADSGQRLDLTGLPKPWVDKHSTGGVGDKTSIVLLPLLAACGLTIVKMSGAGLGITGGTVDKLASIPGFRLALDLDELKSQAKRIGVALTGQTPDLAPADKTLYSLRDSTATVQSVPLIVSSILSKKVAGGAETVVLDVKCGRGAFMQDLENATELAEWLGDIGRRCGLNIRIAITDMNSPLGSTVGNALEVREALDVLRLPATELSAPTKRFRDLCIQLAGETLAAVGSVGSDQEGEGLAAKALEDGQGAAKAEEWIAAQGGPIGIEAVLKSLPVAPEIREVRAITSGWVEAIDAEVVGKAVVDLGGGRHQRGEEIDPSVGVEILSGVGDQVTVGTDLFRVYARNTTEAEAAADRIESAFKISTQPVQPATLLLSKV